MKKNDVLFSYIPSSAKIAIILCILGTIVGYATLDYLKSARPTNPQIISSPYGIYIKNNNITGKMI